MKNIQKRLMLVLFVVIMLLSTLNVFATDYPAAGSPHAIGGDPGDDVDLTETGSAVVIADNVNIANNIDNTSGSDGSGTVTFSGTSTVTGTTGGTNSMLAVNAGEASETVTFNGNVDTTTLNVTGTGAVVINGHLTGNLDFESGADGTFTLGGLDNYIVSGDMTSTVDGEGTVVFTGNNSATLRGDLGADGGNALKLVTIAGTRIVYVEENVNAKSIKFTEDGTLFMQSEGSPKKLTGDITTSTINEGTIELRGTNPITGQIGTDAAELKLFQVTEGNVNISSDLYVNDIYMASRGVPTSLTLAGNILAKDGGGGTQTFTMDTGVAITFDVAEYTFNCDMAVLDINSSNIISFDVTSSGTNGTIDAEDVTTVTVETDTVVDVDTNGNYVYNGQTFTVIDCDEAHAGMNVPTAVTDDSSLVSFAASKTNSNNDLIVTAAKRSFDSVGTTGNASAAGGALENAGRNNPQGDMVVVLDAIEGLNNETLIDNALEQTTPNVNATPVQTVFQSIWQGVNSITNRLDNVRSGINTGATGLSYGEEEFEKSIWVEGFGTYTKQSTRKGIEGYSSKLYGTALGFDTEFGKNTTIGVAGGYAYTDVDNKQFNIGDTTIHSYQGSLYGSYDKGQWFLDGVFTFAWNNYDASRTINFTGINRRADAGYDGQQYSTYVAGGYTYECKGFELTPVASIRYVYLYIDGYEETGAGALNLNVESQDYHLFESGLGGKIEYPIKTEYCTFISEVNAMWLYDFVGDKQETTSRFSGGGSSFNTIGVDPAQQSFSAGAKVTLEIQDNVDLIFDYDCEMKEDYYSHMGGATVKYYF